jgi:1-deoxy-D-xylulose-5-phosphate reductoisomerase
MQQVVILGSTGSIGCSTLDVIRHHQDKYTITALTANSDADKLLSQCLEFKPKYAILLDKSKAIYLDGQLKKHNSITKLLVDKADLVSIVQLPEVDVVMSAIVGSHGLLPTYSAILAGKKVLLANKESLVAGGRLITEALKNNPYSSLIPVDSEHSAIFQSLPSDFTTKMSSINKIILTCSGGPFHALSLDELSKVTPEMAVKHPNWSMGKKISVDSSTLMNKGLEVIEAYWLFGIGLDKIEVVLHPQSIIHSMVEYIDGSIVAQLGTPDMKTPIAYALAYPNRIISGSPKLDFSVLSALTFEQPDYKRFPCLELAYTALKNGRASPAVLNAANEVAVELFLEGKISFYQITQLIESAMQYFGSIDYSTIAEIIEIDLAVRDYTKILV